LRESLTNKTQHLVALAQGGDVAALNQLCKVYSPRVLWMIRLRMGKELRSKLESMDLAQETFISALSGLDDFTYKSEGDFVRWLSKICENELRRNLKRLHAEKRDIRKEIRLDNFEPRSSSGFMGAHKPVDATTPSMILSRKEELDKLEKAMDQLKPEYREAIILTKIEGLSCKEISERLGKSNEAVRKLVSRAILALAAVFESD
jgi:RNA polymerase sigma-70 factor (ECF subfamily)